MKKIVLIGGAGFIGHNLALKLKNRGHKVLIIDGLNVNNFLSIIDPSIANKKLYFEMLNQKINLLNQNKIELVVQEARNYFALTSIVTKFNPDVIVHLAAVSHANKSNKDPHSTFDHSLRTLENALDIARNKKTHFIYLSSSMVYGNFKKEKVDENEICSPIGIYGTLKYSGELIVKSYNHVFNLPYTIIRPSALYGERCVSRRVGQIFIENVIQGKKIIINGTGEEKLDFTYIEDLTDGISKCCENKKAKNQTFNLTYGESRSVNELIKILKKSFPKLKAEYTNKEKFVPERGTLDVSRAKKLINYKPKFSIDKGYRAYIEWYKKMYRQLKIK